MTKHKLLIVTGLSGAGMSSALKALEDNGFEVLDNFPLSLLDDLLKEKPSKPIAIGIDSRTRNFSVPKLKKAVKNNEATLLFMTCKHSILQKRYTETQIVAKLRQADVLIGKGNSVPEVCREIEVSQQTYYRWRQKYGGMSPEMIKEFKELQKENARLKNIVANQAIDLDILKEVAKNF